MRRLNSRVARLERELQENAGQKTSAFHSGCICFPSDEQPIFSFHAERDIARILKCPIHGERFRPNLFIIYRAGWCRKRDFELGWCQHSHQYQKAMRVSFPSSLWPPEANWVDGIGIVLTFKDGTTRPAYEEAGVDLGSARADQPQEGRRHEQT